MKITTSDLITHLHLFPDGLSAAQLCEHFFSHVSPSKKRIIRRLASEAKPTVVSAPSLGYKHIDHCSDEDIMSAVLLHESQAKDEFATARCLREAIDNRKTPQFQITD